MSSLQANAKKSTEFKCQKCNYTSTKRFNVKRHNLIMHKGDALKIKHYIPNIQPSNAHQQLTATGYPFSAAPGATTSFPDPMLISPQYPLRGPSALTSIAGQGNDPAIGPYANSGFPRAQTYPELPMPDSTTGRKTVSSPRPSEDDNIAISPTILSEAQVRTLGSSFSTTGTAASARALREDLAPDSAVTSLGATTESPMQPAVPRLLHPSPTAVAPDQAAPDFLLATIAADSSDGRDSGPEGQAPSTEQHSTNPGRDLSPRLGRGRVARSSVADPLPQYEVRLTKDRGQQQGLDWLHGYSKASFDETYNNTLARWGVKASHWGTCVALPDSWRPADPLTLMDLHKGFNFPKDAPRAWYSYSDWSTTLVRAKVWFDDWPRKGAQLDQFLSAGPWQNMDASHLCHHGHCIIHLVYESAAINASRVDCGAFARLLRANGQEVPAHCKFHNPPCLMQHAALSINEVVLIQFAVLRQARNLPPAEPIHRTRRWPYPTLEQQLPCRFPTVKVTADDLVHEAPSDRIPNKPDLICKFCSAPKAFAGVVALWAHLVYKHSAAGDVARLEEIRRTAKIWRSYGSKCGNSTLAKLEQIEKATFNWDQVLDWNLRK